VSPISIAYELNIKGLPYWLVFNDMEIILRPVNEIAGANIENIFNSILQRKTEWENW
jgi:hypothetical protein